MSQISEAQKKAVRKYKEKAYDRLEISVPKGKKAELQEHATGRGESLNAFINRAADNQVKQDHAIAAYTIPVVEDTGGDNMEGVDNPQ